LGEAILPIHDKPRVLLIVTQDNDFIASQPSRIFAFTVAPSALPGWQPQRAGFSEACVSPSPVT